MLSSFFVISLVFGEMTSLIAKPVPDGTVINTADDMEEMGVSWLAIPFYRVDSFLKLKLPKLAKRKKKMAVRDGLQYVLDHPLEYVYFMSMKLLSLGYG